MGVDFQHLGKLAGPAKLLIAAAAVCLLSIGLCGAAAASHGDVNTLVIVGLSGFGLSLAMFGIGLLWLIIAAIMSRR